MDPWQRDVLMDSLGERADGRWSSFEVGICCPRQNGKSAILEALMLWSLFVDGGLTIYTAHEFKTARELFRRVDGVILQNPDLRSAVRRRVSTAVEMGFEVDNGSRLLFLARSGGSGRGFSGDRFIFDEAMILSADSMLAMLPTLSARPNSQVWYAGSAGMGDSDHWRAVRDRGRSGDSQRLTWLEWAASPDASPQDWDEIAQANPGHPERLSAEAITAEYDAVSASPDTVAGWMRERMGHWDLPTGTGTPVISAEVWAAHAEPDAARPAYPSLALDVSPWRTMSCLAVCGDLDGRPLVEIPGDAELDCRPGTEWVVPRIQALAERLGTNTVHLTGDAAASLQPDLERLGLAVEVLTGAQYAQACGMFFDAVVLPRGTGLVHTAQPELAHALAAARRKDIEHVWHWDRKRPAGDITPLVAATVALWAHTTGALGDPSAYLI